MDNILSFLDEKILFPDYDNYTIIKDMNIKLKDSFIKKMNASNPNETSQERVGNNTEIHTDAATVR